MSEGAYPLPDTVEDVELVVLIDTELAESASEEAVLSASGENGQPR